MLQVHWSKLLVAYLLSATLACGSVVPSTWEWRCQHASQIVASPIAVASNRMPCRMTAMRMSDMACCRSVHRDWVAATRITQALTAPTCNPTLTQIATLPAAQFSETDLHIHISSTFATCGLSTTPAVSFPLTVTLLRRPPPNSCLLHSIHLRSLSPRAPPIA